MKILLRLNLFPAKKDQNQVLEQNEETFLFSMAKNLTPNLLQKSSKWIFFMEMNSLFLKLI